MEQTELEQVLNQVAKDLKLKCSERIYNAQRLPWLCVDESELSGFVKNWSFFSYVDFRKVRMENSAGILFYALADHHVPIKNPEVCKENPAMCTHTIEFVRDFFTQSEEEQQETINNAIRGNLYWDEINLLERVDTTTYPILVRIYSTPKMTLNEHGFFQTDGTSAYVAQSGKKPNSIDLNPGMNFLNALEKEFSREIKRGTFLKERRALCLMRLFFRQEYIPK